MTRIPFFGAAVALSTLFGSPASAQHMEQPLKLDCGVDLAPFQIGYQTYGELNADRSNAILVCHVNAFGLLIRTEACK